jgi:PLP dependent protein
MSPEIQTEILDLSNRLAAVRERIARAAARVNRSADEIELIAVSKTHPTEVLQAAMAAGAQSFGENRVQEAEAKIAEIGRATARWHLIGNLQANKARKAVRLFDLIHTLDSSELAARLDRICEEEGRANLDVLLQVDLAGEATKSGATERELPAILETLAEARHLTLRGLMILPPFFADAEKGRPFFRRLREIRDDLKRQNVFKNGKCELSMGMSQDFETAIEEGSTIVRVGTAIFGARETRK